DALVVGLAELQTRPDLHRRREDEGLARLELLHVDFGIADRREVLVRDRGPEIRWHGGVDELLEDDVGADLRVDDRLGRLPRSEPRDLHLARDRSIGAIEILRQLIGRHLDRQLDGVLRGALDGRLHAATKATGDPSSERVARCTRLPRVYEHERAFALGLADRAADVAMGLFRGDGLEVRRKADLTLVTQADTSIERMLREQIADAFPDDRILGEEEGGSHDPSGRVWIVDPIDGTANFARGIQVWATLIALQIDGRGVLGVASAPALGERYVALAGDGATPNGAPIHGSDVAAVGDAQLLLQEFAEALEGPYRDAVRALIRDSWRGRGFGDFWGHTLVARGSAEVLLEPELSIWDYAAIEVVIRETGGAATTFDGEPLRHRGGRRTTNGPPPEARPAPLPGAHGPVPSPPAR